ncbi:MAG: single-stranded DNA-binding protein [Erysipelotrichaceae bacterium]
MNKVMLVGRVTKDVELRKTNSGTSVASFTVAINRRSSQDNQADFINCVAWNRVAEVMGQYVKKGAQISVEGRIQTRNYEQEGKRVYVTEVVAENVQFLDSRSSRENNSGYSPQQNSNYQADNSFADDNDDVSLDSFDPSSEDLPF